MPPRATVTHNHASAHVHGVTAQHLEAGTLIEIRLRRATPGTQARVTFLGAAAQVHFDHPSFPPGSGTRVDVTLSGPHRLVTHAQHGDVITLLVSRVTDEDLHVLYLDTPDPKAARTRTRVRRRSSTPRPA